MSVARLPVLPFLTAVRRLSDLRLALQVELHHLRESHCGVSDGPMATRELKAAGRRREERLLGNFRRPPFRVRPAYSRQTNTFLLLQIAHSLTLLFLCYHRGIRGTLRGGGQRCNPFVVCVFLFRFRRSSAFLSSSCRRFVTYI